MFSFPNYLRYCGRDSSLCDHLHTYTKSSRWGLEKHNASRVLSRKHLWPINYSRHDGWTRVVCMDHLELHQSLNQCCSLWFWSLHHHSNYYWRSQGIRIILTIYCFVERAMEHVHLLGLECTLLCLNIHEILDHLAYSREVQCHGGWYSLLLERAQILRVESKYQTRTWNRRLCRDC